MLYVLFLIEQKLLTPPKIDSLELVDIICKLPYCRISSVTEHDITKRQTASVYLKQLVSIEPPTERTVSVKKPLTHPQPIRLLNVDRSDLEP